MSALAVTDLPAWLTGSWTVRRTINDGAGTFRGTAEFSADGPGGLRWEEWGRLRLGALDAAARRTLRIVPGDGPAWQVCFDDGRPFHVLDLRSGDCTPHHRCGADTYRGRFTVCDARRMLIRWEVDGPAKADVISSVYRRADPGAGVS